MKSMMQWLFIVCLFSLGLLPCAAPCGTQTQSGDPIDVTYMAAVSGKSDIVNADGSRDIWLEKG